MSERKYDFSDEEQFYYERVFDLIENALRLLWERGEHDQREKDLDLAWNSLMPVLKEVFDKAKIYDRLDLGIEEHFILTHKTRITSDTKS